jgi:hypothetical protein
MCEKNLDEIAARKSRQNTVRWVGTCLNDKIRLSELHFAGGARQGELKNERVVL